MSMVPGGAEFAQEDDAVLTAQAVLIITAVVVAFACMWCAFYASIRACFGWNARARHHWTARDLHDVEMRGAKHAKTTKVATTGPPPILVAQPDNTLTLGVRP